MVQEKTERISVPKIGLVFKLLIILKFIFSLDGEKSRLRGIPVARYSNQNISRGPSHELHCNIQ